MVAKKKRGQLRFCVNYRRLNTQTIVDVFPMPDVKETLDALAHAKYFSVMNARAGYWQVLMDPSDVPKTGFVTRRGKYEWLVMPFRLVNALATFQRMMNMVLTGLVWELCLVYVDNIIMFSETFEQHMVDLQKVFGRLKVAGIRLHPDKCSFCQKKTKFLGHVVCADGIKPDPDKVSAVMTFAAPHTLKQLCGFLGCWATTESSLMTQWPSY